MPIDTVRSRVGLAAALVAVVLHLLVGYLYLGSGLVMPLWALLPLWLWWFVLAGQLVRLAVQRSPWVLLVPAVALATWVLLLLAGGELLGWTA